jgi:hypothetical protein
VTEVFVSCLCSCRLNTFNWGMIAYLIFNIHSIPLYEEGNSIHLIKRAKLVFLISAIRHYFSSLLF